MELLSYGNSFISPFSVFTFLVSLLIMPIILCLVFQMVALWLYVCNWWNDRNFFVDLITQAFTFLSYSSWSPVLCVCFNQFCALLCDGSEVEAGSDGSYWTSFKTSIGVYLTFTFLTSMSQWAQFKSPFDASLVPLPSSQFQPFFWILIKSGTAMLSILVIVWLSLFLGNARSELCLCFP